MDDFAKLTQTRKSLIRQILKEVSLSVIPSFYRILPVHFVYKGQDDLDIIGHRDVDAFVTFESNPSA